MYFKLLRTPVSCKFVSVVCRDNMCVHPKMCQRGLGNACFATSLDLGQFRNLCYHTEEASCLFSADLI